MQKIILASRSPRRKQLLQWAEIPFEVRSSETAEDYPADLLPHEVAVHIARNKALAILQDNKADNPEQAPVLAADTIVVFNDEIIGKPTDRKNAISILQKLSGKKHLVITGAVILFNKNEVAFADITEVEFHELTTEQIEFYVDNYKPFDKAGAYAIQEWIGVVGIKSINGDFYNVMGLPISRVVRELEKIKK